MPEAHARRRDALRARMAAANLDAALITRLVNVRYLTGLVSSNAALLVTADNAVIATDGRYRAQAAEQAPDVDVIVQRDVAAALASRLSQGRLGFESHQVTVDAYESLSHLGAVSFVSLDRAVEELRAVKDEGEIELLREACAIADRALADVLPKIHAGRTERDIAVELEANMREYGAEAPAFETIVAAGPNSAIPHHRAADGVLNEGDLLKIDFGARYDGYHSDMTRTFCVGEPAEWQRELHELVAAAQLAGRNAVAPGAGVHDVDEAARSIIEAAGHGSDYPHGLGHGVGLEIHEAPSLGYNNTATLEERMPVTVEPGVYLDGRGGVRIEDTVVVRAGAPQILTSSPRELLVLG